MLTVEQSVHPQSSHLMSHDVGSLQDPCQPKVCNSCNIAAPVQKHIPRLAVKPDNAPFVKIRQAASNAQGNETPLLIPASLPWPGFVSAYSPGQVATLHELCHQKYLLSKHLLNLLGAAGQVTGLQDAYGRCEDELETHQMSC